MKSKDLQNIVFSKYQKGDTPTEIHRWNQFSDDQKLVLDESSIWLLSPARYTCWSTDSQDTKENIQTVKNRLHRKQKLLARKLSGGGGLGISAKSVRPILKIDLGLKLYKKIIANDYFSMIRKSDGNSL